MKLFEELTMARIESRLPKLFERLSQYDLLILDDFAIKKITAEQVLDLMKIIEDRHGNKSTIFASQLPVANWYETLNSNVSAADAILDRVVNTASRFALKGDSLRKKTITLPRQNCNSMAVFAVTVCSVFTTLCMMSEQLARRLLSLSIFAYMRSSSVFRFGTEAVIIWFLH